MKLILPIIIILSGCIRSYTTNVGNGEKRKEFTIRFKRFSSTDYKRYSWTKTYDSITNHKIKREFSVLEGGCFYQRVKYSFEKIYNKNDKIIEEIKFDHHIGDTLNVLKHTYLNIHKKDSIVRYDTAWSGGF